MIKVQNEEQWKAHPRIHPPWVRLLQQWVRTLIMAERESAGLLAKAASHTSALCGTMAARKASRGRTPVSYLLLTWASSNCIILPDKRMGIIMITNVNTNVWRLPPFSVRALQIATQSAPTEDNDANEGGDE